MIELTKENLDCVNYVDKQEKKVNFLKNIMNKNKALVYMFGAFVIFSIANLTLIYSFFKILNTL